MLKQQLENSEQRVQALIDSNDDMRSEISRLSSMVNKVRCCFENPNNKNSILKANFSKKPAKKIFSLLGGKIEFYYIIFPPRILKIILAGFLEKLITFIYCY